LEYLLLQDKAYRAQIRLGVGTDTLDREGAIVATRPVPDLGEAVLEHALARFRGPQRQQVPEFSAIQQDGERLYQRARRGEAVDAPVRDITVHRLHLVTWQPPDLTVDVLCSKGTYVRALARDLGEALGSVGTLWNLRRTRSGAFGLDQAVDLERVQREPDGLSLLPMEAMVAELPRVTLDAEAALALSRGLALAQPAGVDPGTCALFCTDGTLLAIGHADGTHLRPHKVLRPAEE